MQKRDVLALSKCNDTTNHSVKQHVALFFPSYSFFSFQNWLALYGARSSLKGYILSFVSHFTSASTSSWCAQFIFCQQHHGLFIFLILLSYKTRLPFLVNFFIKPCVLPTGQPFSFCLVFFLWFVRVSAVLFFLALQLSPREGNTLFHLWRNL